MTHTKGPWHTTVIDTINGAPAMWAICDIQKGFIATVDSVNEADARLIAAAPETAAERDRLLTINADLLAALEDLQALIRRDIGPKFADAMPQCLRARDLIVRARGTA